MANLIAGDNAIFCRGADLTGANFYNAFFGDTNFWYANLTNANFNWANVINSQMNYAILTGANLTNASFEGSTGCSTVTPTGTLNGLC